MGKIRTLVSGSAESSNCMAMEGSAINTIPNIQQCYTSNTPRLTDTPFSIFRGSGSETTLGSFVKTPMAPMTGRD